MANPGYTDLTLKNAMPFVEGDSETAKLLRMLSQRVNDAREEMTEFRLWCDRADKLFYAERYTLGGADLWPDDPSATTPGASHVSINLPEAYVAIPAALQSTEPIENMRATEESEGARSAAASIERIYTSWKNDENYELKFHKACVIKGLYGRTFGKVYWDKDKLDGAGAPCVEVLEQPRNLWMGFANDSYEKPEWAAYVQFMTPEAVMDEFGVEITVRDSNGTSMPFIEAQPDPRFTSPDGEARNARRPWLNLGPTMVEVWDYWYRKPRTNKNGKVLGWDTWNVILAGTACLRGPVKYTEYKGKMPYIPLYNSFIPGVPNGRPELRDMEPIIRETYERMTSGSQMIASATAGDFWQLTGADSTPHQAAGLKPVRNAVISPGPGNRIETITPFIAQFQLDQFLGRLDRYGSIISGLNDLLLGLAPAQVLSSSKAINALIANYESRIAIKRQLLYVWRRGIWTLALSIWAQKDKTIADIVKRGGGWLDITDPSLSPRDDMETMQRAINAVNAKLASQRTAMDWIGIDDPETELNLIREERTDATLFPAEVQVMVQLISALQAVGIQPGADAQAQAQAQATSGQNDLRMALGQAVPGGTNATQGADVQGITPPGAGTPPPGGGPAGTPFIQGPPAAQLGVAQTMIQGGKAQSRILTQQKLGRR